MIDIMTWNCQGFKNNGTWLDSIINSYDIIALQETWLHEHECHRLNIFKNYYAIAKSGMPVTRLNMQGRPYGGVAFLIKSDLEKSVTAVTYEDPRIIAVKIETTNGELLLLNVYFPVNTRENESLFSKYFGRLQAIITDHDGPSLIIGDFNIDKKHQNYIELENFCRECDCELSDVKHLTHNTFTFCSKGTGVTSWLDHVVNSKDLNGYIQLISTPHIITPSDHIPIAIKLKLSATRRTSEENDNNKFRTQINWKKISPHMRSQYQDAVTRNLETLCDIELCETKGCKNALHCENITRWCHAFIKAFKDAEAQVLLQLRTRQLQSSSQSKNWKCTPGWNDHLKYIYKMYKHSYCAWIKSGKSDVHAMDTMKHHQRKFKYALRKVRKQRDKIQSDKLALSYEGNDLTKFWRHVKLQDGERSVISVETINGASSNEDICEMWRNHYASNFTSITNTSATHSAMQNPCPPNEKLARPNSEQVKECIKSLKKGKSPGPDGIAAESLQIVSGISSELLASFYNSCLSHSFIPDIVMRVTIVPILKKKGLDKSKVQNYRPIALATILSKVFELIFLSIYHNNLNTHYGQFGYKKGVGTETAVFTLRQVCHFYLRKNSPVYLCYLDATKAFDYVDHGILLQKLRKRGIDDDTLGLFRYWFCSQTFVCRWNDVISSTFPVHRGVRQGGIASAYFFAIYMDDLCVKLARTGLGCHVGARPCNYLCYADDFCLLATSVRVLQLLVKMCETYATEHSISFNPTKTYCQAFINKSMDTVRPIVRICGKNIAWVDSVKYLGYTVNCWDRDTAELIKRRRDLYAYGNLLSCRFQSCSANVKRYLFTTFFSNIYCSSLWVPVQQKYLKQMQVAYNDVFRSMFNYSRRSSASKMFAENGISDFTAMRRRAVYSLLSRLSTSNNVILKSIFNSRMLIDSSLFKDWKELLLGPDHSCEDLYKIISRFAK
ncbi:unnamed protein product [Orchesella dallaii]|uniref:Reverse transcriptase domain-containing protein n=1 Tax=Orchesella dallaii TaxID=48710 RepID=A0ABP1RFZ7_9HEXA